MNIYSKNSTFQEIYEETTKAIDDYLYLKIEKDFATKLEVYELHDKQNFVWRQDN